MSLADRINECAADFTPAEHRIAQVLISSNLLAGLETIVKLGEKAKVSGPTVLRFSAKLGFASYPDLQDYLREDLKDRLASPVDLYERQRRSDGARGGIDDAARIFGDGIGRTLARLDAATLKKVTALLVDKSRPVHFAGGRFTQHIAELLFGYVHLLRPRAHILRQGVMSPRDMVIDMGRRDVLVVFDIRRYQAETIELAERAHARRVTIILVTDTYLSPISRISDFVLTCDLDAPSPQDSLVPCMAVVEVIVAALSRLAGEAGRERMIAVEALHRDG